MVCTPEETLQRLLSCRIKDFVNVPTELIHTEEVVNTFQY